MPGEQAAGGQAGAAQAVDGADHDIAEVVHTPIRPGLAILQTIGFLLVVIGVVLWILGSMGRAVGGRKHYYSRTVLVGGPTLFNPPTFLASHGAQDPPHPLINAREVS